MRLYILLLVALICGALSRRAMSENISDDDVRTQEIAGLRAEVAKLRADLHWCEVKLKHGVGDGDEIKPTSDGKALEIVRKAKPAAAAPTTSKGGPK